jgi:hypothetical protein
MKAGRQFSSCLDIRCRTNQSNTMLNKIYSRHVTVPAPYDKYFSKLKLFFCCITCKHREEGEGGKLEVGWPRDSCWHSCPPLRLLSAHPYCFSAKPVVYRPLALRIFSAVKERGSTSIFLRWVGIHRISLFK